MASSRMSVLIIYLWILMLYRKPGLLTADNLPMYEKVDEELVTPQWLQKDTYDVDRQMKSNDSWYIRYPHPEQRFKMTHENQELLLLSKVGYELVPSLKEQLQISKRPKKILSSFEFQFLFPMGTNAKHRFAEALNLRRKNFGSSDEILVPFLYFPTGWPLLLFIAYLLAIFLVPAIGSLLVHLGFHLGSFYYNFIWGPIKFILRTILVKREVHNQWWRRFLAPPHFLEPHPTWKMPYLLRNDILEDITPELAYKPPINKIDYSMYILSPDDYDDLDLAMDELEFIDDMLQFRDEKPKLVASLLKYKLGIDKFYYYFEEDILSDEEFEDDQPKPEEKPAEPEKPADGEQPTPSEAELNAEEQRKNFDADYFQVLKIDEPWMHKDYDEIFDGTPEELAEIRKRRDIVAELKEEILELHHLIQQGSKYDSDLTEHSVEERIALQKQAQKKIDRYLRYSKMTKERIEELEPSGKIKNVHNVALSKYLPLINEMSHYNHRLNLRHDKQKDPTKRKIQLDIFGAP